MIARTESDCRRCVRVRRGGDESSDGDAQHWPAAARACCDDVLAVCCSLCARADHRAFALAKRCRDHARPHSLSALVVGRCDDDDDARRRDGAWLRAMSSTRRRCCSDEQEGDVVVASRYRHVADACRCQCVAFSFVVPSDRCFSFFSDAVCDAASLSSQQISFNANHM